MTTLSPREMSDSYPEQDPINQLPLETQLHYQITMGQIKQMSHEQLLDFTIMLFKTHLIQYNNVKEILKQQLVNDIYKGHQSKQ